MLAMLRVDHRLIHGQVALSWTASLNADAILIPDDAVVNDPIQKTTLKMAAPTGIKVVIKNLDDSVEAINSGKTDKYHLFIVAKTVQAAAELASRCKIITEVNLGNVAQKPGSTQLTKSVYLTTEEKQYVNQMIDQGISVFTQQVPTDTKSILTSHV